jgi:hypothetical protein
MKRYRRRVSPLERYNLVIHRAYHYHVDGVVEGQGKLDETTLRAAIATAAAANPGIRVRMRGWLGWARWVDSGRAPPLHVVNDCLWDGNSEQHAPFYGTRLEVDQVADLWLLNCRDGQTRLVFRALHAAVDGRGMFHWMNEVFRALRGEPLQGSPATLIDLDVQAQHRQAVEAIRKAEAARAAQSGPPQVGGPDAELPAPSPHCLPVLEAGENRPQGYVWRRIVVPGPVSNQLARSAKFLADWARRRGPGVVGFTVPVDYRGLRTEEMGLGNLTGYTRLTVAGDDTPRSLMVQLNRKIKAMVDCRGIPMIRLVWWWPLASLVRGLKKKSATVLYTLNKDAPSGGVVSMGAWKREWFDCAGFKAGLIYGIPGSVGRLNVLFSNFDDCAVVTFAVPAGFNDRGQLDAMIAAYLEHFSL